MVAALLSKMGYKDGERIQVKLEFLRMMSRMELDPAKTELLYGFFETYLKLNEEEEEKMMEEIAKLPHEEAKQLFRLPNSFFEKGFNKGIEQGFQKGIEHEKKLLVNEMLKKGLQEELIVEISKLSVEKVKEMKKELEESSDY